MNPWVSTLHGKERFESTSSNGSTLRGQRMIPTLSLQLPLTQKQAVFRPTGLEWDPHLSARGKKNKSTVPDPFAHQIKKNKK